MQNHALSISLNVLGRKDEIVSNVLQITDKFNSRWGNLTIYAYELNQW